MGKQRNTNEIRPGRTKSFYISKGAVSVLGLRTHTSARTESAVMSRTVERYGYAIAQATPKLSAAEWQMLAESLKGVVFDEPPAIAHLADILPIQGKGAKLDHLVRKVESLTYAEKLAVVDQVEMYHAAVDRGEAAEIPAFPRIPTTPAGVRIT